MKFLSDVDMRMRAMPPVTEFSPKVSMPSVLQTAYAAKINNIATQPPTKFTCNAPAALSFGPAARHD
jgi:hypothetical protein